MRGNENHPSASVAAVLAVPVVAALLLALFAWPQARSGPRELPVGVAGPPSATAAIEQRLARGEAFGVRRYAHEAAARQAIRDREVYGAIAVSSAGATVLTASAASPAAAQLLERTASPPRSGDGAPGRPPPLRVVDVVPADADDPRGAALTGSVLPLLLVGIIAGFLVASATRPGPRQAGALVCASVLGGVAAVAVVQGWLGVIGGRWTVNAAVLSLMVLAIGSVAAGLTALLGRAGLVVAALVMVLLGNPWSGMSSAPEMLPRPIGAIGQLLPPGAGGNALRGTAFFDGAESEGHVLVLGAWAALGLAAVAAAAVGRRRRPRVLPLRERALWGRRQGLGTGAE